MTILFLIYGCENKNNKENNVHIDTVCISAKTDSIKLVHDTLVIDTCLRKAPVAYILNTMTKLYTNIDNPIEICTMNISDDSIIVKSEPNGIVFRAGKGYIVKPIKSGLLNVVVYKHENNNDILIGKRQFRVERLPDAIPKVGGKRNTVIDKNELLNQTGITVVNEECCWNINYKIIEFTVSTTNEQGKVVENISTSKMFTEAQKSQIRKLKSGQKIYFENIKVIDMDGNTRNVGVIMLKIK